MAQALALGAQALSSVSGSKPVGRLDERPKLRETRLLGGGVARQLVVPPPGRRELAPGAAQLSPPALLLLAGVRVEHVELVRGPRQPALLELAGHREQALGRGGEILACDRAAPGVRARSSVREDAAREDEAGLVLGRERGERLQLVVVEEAVGHVELRLDVRLARARPDRGRVALRAEQEPERLREDRLPRPGLARDRVQPRRRRELGRSDQDEVLDVEATTAERPAVAAEEGRLGQGREERALLADPRDHATAGREIDARGARPRAPSRARSTVRFQTIASRPRGTTSGRAFSECGATKVIAIASSPQTSTGPPFEKL